MRKNGPVALAVMGALVLCGGAAVALPITDFAIFSDYKVDIDYDSTVDCGPVGSNGSIQALGHDGNITFFLTGGGKLDANYAVDVDGNIIFNDDVSIGHNGDIGGNIDSGGDVDVDYSAHVHGNITAAGKINLGHHVIVGDVGTPKNVRAGGDVVVSYNAHIYGDASADGTVAGSTGKIDLGHDTVIDGTATHFGALILGASATVGSSVVGHFPVSPVSFSPVSLLSPTAFVGGGADMTVAHDQPAVTLAPNVHYGTVNLGYKDILNLSSGTYWFDALSMGHTGTLNLDLTGGGINIFVVGLADFDYELAVNLIGGDATDVYCETMKKWTVGHDSQWFGTIYAPEQTTSTMYGIDFSYNCDIEGALYSGAKIMLGHDTNMCFELADVLNPEGPAEVTVPEPATMALFGLGALGMAIRRIRSRK